MTAIASIRNLGPATEKAFRRAGITSAEELHEMGCDAAYLAALRSGMTAHFAAYMSLCLGLQGRPWTDAAATEKAEMRARFDALRDQLRREGPAGDGPSGDLERFLDRIGLPG